MFYATKLVVTMVVAVPLKDTLRKVIRAYPFTGTITGVVYVVLIFVPNPLALIVMVPDPVLLFSRYTMYTLLTGSAFVKSIAEIVCAVVDPEKVML